MKHNDEWQLGAMDKLFKFFADEHDLILTDGELSDIVHAVASLRISQSTGNFLTVLEENYQATKTLTEQDIKEDYLYDNFFYEWERIRNVMLETYEDLIEIYKNGKWSQKTNNS